MNNLSLSPKSLFRQNEDQVKAFKAISHNTHFMQALSSSLAEFANNWNPSTEELSGARQFISVLLNIAEDKALTPKVPVKKLDHTVLQPNP